MQKNTGLRCQSSGAGPNHDDACPFDAAYAANTSDTNRSFDGRGCHSNGTVDRNGSTSTQVPSENSRIAAASSDCDFFATTNACTTS